MQKFYVQAKKYGAEFLDDDILKMEKDSNGFVIYSASHKFIHTKTMIIALGTQRKKLNIGHWKFIAY